jgi:hypothetical protein
MPTFYAVARGRAPGIYRSWDETKRQVDKFSGAIHKSFKTEAEAKKYIDEHNKPAAVATAPSSLASSKSGQPDNATRSTEAGSGQGTASSLGRATSTIPLRATESTDVRGSTAHEAPTGPLAAHSAHLGAGSKRRAESALPSMEGGAHFCGTVRITEDLSWADNQGTAMLADASSTNPVSVLRRKDAASRWGYVRDTSGGVVGSKRLSRTRWGFVAEAAEATVTDHSGEQGLAATSGFAASGISLG